MKTALTTLFCLPLLGCQASENRMKPQVQNSENQVAVPNAAPIPKTPEERTKEITAKSGMNSYFDTKFPPNSELLVMEFYNGVFGASGKIKGSQTRRKSGASWYFDTQKCAKVPVYYAAVSVRSVYLVALSSSKNDHVVRCAIQNTENDLYGFSAGISSADTAMWEQRDERPFAQFHRNSENPNAQTH